jgi:hypothetical protein
MVGFWEKVNFMISVITIILKKPNGQFLQNPPLL